MAEGSFRKLAVDKNKNYAANCVQNALLSEIVVMTDARKTQKKLRFEAN